MKVRKKHLRRIMAGMLTGVMLANAAVSDLTTVTVSAASGSGVVAGEIAVNPELHYQTLRGWGTSMCWWGNIIGSWGDKDFNGNGRPDREEIAELAFSPEYLNLNIVRYNVGGGDKEDTSIKRVEGLVPGWTIDMTGTKDGTGAFNAEAFYSKDTKDMNDAGQLWMLEAANQWRKDTAEENGAENDIINEVFSNSPPYYMTNSGSSTGGNNAASNLKTDCYDDFAMYMARAAKWIDNDLKEKFGTGVDYIEPMNEPDTNYWKNGSTKQEGCTFQPGTEQSNMLLAMQDALNAEEFDGSLSDIAITGTDETALSNAINSFNRLSSDAKNSITTISAHTYSGDDSERNTLRKLAQSYDKELWMSEITRGGGTHNHNSMVESQTKSQSEGIMADLKYMQPSAWIAWLVADSEYECLKFDENWGLIHAVFESDGPVPDYHTNLVENDGSPKEGIPEEGYWAVTKQLYTMMQYSKFLKAGYTMIDIGDSDMCAAMSPDGKELVIVAQNFSRNRNTTVDLSAFTNRGNVELYRTSDAENCELVDDSLDITNGILDVTLPQYSVSTYVIEAEANMDNYAVIVEADVEKPSADGVDVSDLNKFTYTGTWSGQTTTEENASAAFTFQGAQAELIGTKSPTGGKVLISVDDGVAEEVDLKADMEMPEAILCKTGELSDGKHTITVTLAENQDTQNASLALSYARILHGEVSQSKPVIRRVVPYDGKLAVYFDEVVGSGTYTVRYGTSESNLDQHIDVSTNRAVLTGLTNGTVYYIQAEDTLGGKSDVASAVPDVPDGNTAYFVNVGTSNLYSPAADEEFGRYNSILDQAYGADPITGKNWGYIGDTAAYYQDQDRWGSVRERADGMEYQFELPAGSYNVTIAMQDPWADSGRATDIIINGETKAENLVPMSGIIRAYKAEVASDGILSVKAVKSSSNKNQSPMISYIIVSDYQSGEISEIPQRETLYTVSGVVIPQLPKTVPAITVDGETMEKAVAWERIDVEKFIGADYSTVTVQGIVDGTDFSVSQLVQIIPANLQYFIDCNWPESTQYAGINAVADLKNEVADKAYVNGSWGYTSTAAGWDSADTNTSGWYDPSDGMIRYKVPLSAGNYAVAFGFYDWWYGEPNRPTYLRAYIEGSTEAYEDWGLYQMSSRPAQTTGKLSLEGDNLVTLSVEKGSNDNPILSWLSVQNILNLDALKAQINQARTLKRENYTEELLEELDVAAAEGMEQLFKSDATQQSVDAAEKNLQAAIEELDPAVPDITISGPTEMTLTEGYAASSSEVFTITGEGSPQVTVSGNTGDGKITWNSETKKLDIAAGLTAGSYEVTVSAAGGNSVTFTLTVEEGQPGQDGQNKKVTSITVTGDTHEITIGQTLQLSVSVLPTDAAQKDVNWNSSRTDIAAVSGTGLVTPVSAGTATITAAAADGSGVEGTFEITVIGQQGAQGSQGGQQGAQGNQGGQQSQAKVTKIALKSAFQKVAAKKKTKITATVTASGSGANKEVTYSSSNSKYATVNAKGVVTTKQAGAGKTVTITATAKDGSGVKGTVKIKIMKHAVKKITLKGSSKVSAGKSVKLKATVKTTGKSANTKLAYSSSNKKYATVSAKGVVKTKKAGKGKTVTIKAVATDGTNKKASIKIKIK